MQKAVFVAVVVIGFASAAVAIVLRVRIDTEGCMQCSSDLWVPQMVLSSIIL